MTPITLNRPAIVRAMRSAIRAGVDPYNSHDTYAAKAARALADKARRMRDRDPYPFHVAAGAL